MHIRFVLAAALVAYSGLSLAGNGYKALPITQTIQEHSNWCWSASSVATLKLYGQSPSQCSVANYARSINYACGNTTFNWNSPANQPAGIYGGSGTIQSILLHWGLASTGRASALSWSSTVSQINANRPFVMRFGWTNGGGHFLVPYGYDDRSGTQRIGYMNPWPGEGNTWSTFSWTVNASDHRWTHTLTMNR